MLDYSGIVCIESELRKAISKTIRPESLDLQTMLCECPFDATDQFAVGPTDGDTRAIDEQSLSRTLFHIAPGCKRLSAKRHVVRMFVVGRPNDACVPVR